MPNIKLLLTDMDGTIVQFGKHEVSGKVRRAIADCETNGIRVSAVTGRQIEMARPALELLGFTDPCIFDNGATIANPVTGEILWQKTLPVNLVKQIALILMPGAQDLDYAPVVELHAVADDEIDFIAAIHRPTPSIFALLKTASVADICQQLDTIEEISYYTAASTRGHAASEFVGIQISPVDATKFYGVEQLRAMNGIAKSETAAIGDHTNDLPLFQNASMKFAMGNANDELKAASDYVVADIDNDGFAEAVYEYILL